MTPLDRTAAAAEEARSWLMPDDWEPHQQQDPHAWRISKAYLVFWEAVRLEWSDFAERSDEHARAKRVCLWLWGREHAGISPFDIVNIGRSLCYGPDLEHVTRPGAEWAPAWTALLPRVHETLALKESIGDLDV